MTDGLGNIFASRDPSVPLGNCDDAVVGGSKSWHDLTARIDVVPGACGNIDAVRYSYHHSDVLEH